MSKHQTAGAQPRVTPELIEAAVRRGRQMRSEAVHAFFRALFAGRGAPSQVRPERRTSALDAAGLAGFAGRC